MNKGRGNWFVVGEIYLRYKIDENCRMILIKKAGGLHPTCRQGKHLGLIIETENKHYYHFIHLTGTPTEGRWKCVSEHC
ncbi:MAG: hypothetical protein MI740_10345 [Halanaerobiales bacterium]|nr:hypothetical protein [Halanaerobiales bacterium]